MIAKNNCGLDCNEELAVKMGLIQGPVSNRTWSKWWQELSWLSAACHSKHRESFFCNRSPRWILLKKPSALPSIRVAHVSRSWVIWVQWRPDCSVLEFSDPPSCSRRCNYALRRNDEQRKSYFRICSYNWSRCPSFYCKPCIFSTSFVFWH